MSLRFRKSIRICKGMRLNFSKSGIGLSMGIRGARFSIGANGRNTISIGIPGTGIYYSSSYSRSAKKRASKNVQQRYNSINETKIYSDLDVKKYNSYKEKLTMIHKQCSDSVDWEYLYRSEAPFKGKIGPLEKIAKEEYETLKPTLAEKIFASKFEQKKKLAENKVLEEREKDKEAYEAWETSVQCAKLIIEKDINGYYDAINSCEPFEELSELGSDFEFGTDNSTYIEVEFKSKLHEILPIDKFEYTPTGKVSHKKVSKKELFEIAEDYLCSCSIRVARELFALLPIEKVIVHAVQEQVNGRGEIEEGTLLSVIFDKDSFNKIDFSRIDASDFVNTYINNFSCVRGVGFKPVQRLTCEDLDRKLVDIDLINKTKNNDIFNHLELPFGWSSQNKDFIDKWDGELAKCRIDYYHSTNVSDKIMNLKKLIKCFNDYKKECDSLGVYFQKYFYDMQMCNAGKKYDWIKKWKKELTDLEDMYLDARESEDAINNTKETIEDDIIKILESKPGILQKDLVKEFNPLIKQLVLDTLYKIQCDGKLVKEKFGNSNKLYFKK